MNFENYKGKKVTIKSNSQEGTVESLVHKRGKGGLAVEFSVRDTNGKLHALMPHQLKLAV